MVDFSPRYYSAHRSSAIQRWAKLPVSSNVLLLPPISKAPLRFHRKKKFLRDSCNSFCVLLRSYLFPPKTDELCRPATRWKVREQWKCLLEFFYLPCHAFCWQLYNYRVVARVSQTGYAIYCRKSNLVTTRFIDYVLFLAYLTSVFLLPFIDLIYKGLASFFSQLDTSKNKHTVLSVVKSK